MPAYALARLRRPAEFHPEVGRYLAGIQRTLDPFGGRFVVHGAEVEVREGSWDGDLVVIEFDDLVSARSWYESEAYQQILPLRTRHLAGDVILVDGVGRDHDSAAMAGALGAGATA
ncbi:DUF1330 domain-containing protein [Actinoalloteichus hymeniacidonis]|uniref:DUF1330 domain-containing protein n=1 Tax=Actinoalloteichus hymeniacidonis TaxID=340345 RepID=A0AAC9HT03_9PSEU|nr:DUF1330 domain-containing protein [Actinoalloteichus hymeniacidonis]AOS63935.1 hypothetical protein TL08_15630 [Actinoalloteichus hymeniacidonis]MBB5908008.1 uncharacterized protein (DUF1330 family) [Actinoalloteichus hymeniacidonis]